LYERGASSEEIVSATETEVNHDGQKSIISTAFKIVLFLEGDRHSWLEGWEKLRSASHLSGIDLEQKFISKQHLTKDETKHLMNSVMDVKKYGSRAALIWLIEESSVGFASFCLSSVCPLLANRASYAKPKCFSTLDLTLRDKYIIKAKEEEKSSVSEFTPWLKGMPRSPEINNISNWPAPGCQAM
jgi:hypothetical protein